MAKYKNRTQMEKGGGETYTTTSVLNSFLHFIDGDLAVLGELVVVIS